MASSLHRQYLWPICIGVLTFFLVAGPWPLLPTNRLWLSGIDPAQQLLGWEFFRHSPWAFPLGLNPRYGLEISSSIIFTDSIPLMALVFKSLSPFLPDSFQYFGLWTLACFILQAIFSWKLAQLITDQLWQKIALCILLGMFSLPMLKRLGVHASLMAHFLILASLYCTFKPEFKFRSIYWGAILAVSALTHFYLFVMVALLWMSDLIDRVLQKKGEVTSSFSHLSRATQNLLWEASFISLIVLLVAWMAGYFFSATPTLTTEGFGTYKLNLLSLVDARQWSYLLPSIDHPPDLDEGFNFIGLGFLFLIPFAAYQAYRLRAYWVAKLTGYPAFVFTMFLLTLFSLSNQISIGNLTFSYSWPDFILNKVGILRSSARLFWPVFYVFCFFILTLIVRGYSRKKSTVLLLCACLLQIWDSSAGWLPNRQRMTNESLFAPQAELSNPFWHAAADHYSQIKVYPLKVGPMQPYWYQLSNLAAQHHIATNAVYLGRGVNTAAVNQANQLFEEQKRSGEYDINTLYVLDEWKNHPELPSPKINPAKDLLAQINGFTVLAPNWKACKECPQVDPQLEIATHAPLTKIDEPIVFSSSGDGYLFLKQVGHVQRGYGWSFPEAWGIWSDGSFANMTLPIPKQQPRLLQIKAQALISKQHPKTELVVEINRSQKISITLNKEGINTFDIPVPENIRYPEFLDIQFHFLNAASPVEIGIPGNDHRKLSLGLISATFLR